MKQYLILVLCIIYLSPGITQNNYSIEIIHQGVNTSLRGLSVVKDSVIWVSGSDGYVGRSIDAGKTWNFQKIHPYDSAEFRDIEAIDAQTAIVMSSVEPSCILKTTDGGNTWKEVFRNNDPAMFLDAIDFYNNSGICLGDPMHGRFYLMKTNDLGDTWTVLKTRRKSADSIAAFAASGSVIQFIDEKTIVFATGGKYANIYISKNRGKRWKEINTPIIAGQASQGIFSIDFKGNAGIIAGGNYLEPNNEEKSLFMANDILQTRNIWKNYSVNSIGYSSCAKLYQNLILTCGTSGINLIDPILNNTTKLSEENFNVIGISEDEKTVYFAGNNGKIVRLVIN